jgi:hypothetical protein
MNQAHGIDRGGIAVAFAALGVAGYVLWEAQDFSALGAVFPRFIAGAVGLAALGLLAAALFGRQRPAADEGGSDLRRGALAAALTAWAALIPFAGFLVSSLLGFFAVGLVAKYEAWPPARWLVFAFSALATIVSMYALFTAALDVPLPAGSLFGG